MYRSFGSLCWSARLAFQSLYTVATPLRSHCWLPLSSSGSVLSSAVPSSAPFFNSLWRAVHCQFIFTIGPLPIHCHHLVSHARGRWLTCARGRAGGRGLWAYALTHTRSGRFPFRQIVLYAESDFSVYRIRFHFLYTESDFSVHRIRFRDPGTLPAPVLAAASCCRRYGGCVRCTAAEGATVSDANVNCDAKSCEPRSVTQPSTQSVTSKT